MKKLLLAILLTGCSIGAHAETIRFATEASYPPFESMDASGNIIGFDIDVAKLLCKEMQATCTFQNQSFDSLVAGLKFRRFDAVIAAMDITPEREKQVLFTQSYYHNVHRFIARTGTYTSIDQLAGKRVGVQNGSTPQKYLQQRQPQMNSIPYDSYQNARLDLENGRIDAVFGDVDMTGIWLTPGGKLQQLGDKVTDTEYFDRGLGIAVRQGNTELQQKLNAALEKVQQDGSYQAVYQKWFKQ